jgi:hypothetical protein
VTAFVFMSDRVCKVHGGEHVFCTKWERDPVARGEGIISAATRDLAGGEINEFSPLASNKPT